MSDFLKQMAQSSRDRVCAAEVSFTDDDLDRPVRPLQLAGFDLIAEIKNRSPAEGELGRLPPILPPPPPPRRGGQRRSVNTSCPMSCIHAARPVLLSRHSSALYSSRPPS